MEYSTCKMTENKGKIIERHEIEEQYKWKTEDMFINGEAWEADFLEVKNQIPELEQYRGRLLESADVLLSFLTLRDGVFRKVSLLFSYAARKKDEDTRVSENQSLYNRSLSLMTQIQSASSFFGPEILAASEETLNGLLQSNSALGLYRKEIEDITRLREHYLSADMERVVAMTREISSSPQQIFNMIDNADMTYPSVRDEEGNEVQLTKSRFFKLLQSKNREVRKEAFEKFYQPYESQKNTLAATLAAGVKADLFHTRVRKFDSTLEAALSVDNIPVSVYHNLIQAITDNMDSMHKYVRLRKKALGVDELHMYDIYVSIINDVEMEIPFAEAKETVIEAMAPLGKEYQEILRKGLESRWVDVYENAGKTSGAYSAGVYGVHPFVLMNYNNTLDHMFTLAHEMGHALHSYLSNQTQPFVYHRYKIFLAEVASTLNEALLMDYLLKKTTDKGLRLVILNHFLEQFRGTMYRQTMFAEFEMLAHGMVGEGKTLTHENMTDMYLKLNQKYYGPDMVSDPQIGYEWGRIPHFYTSFYVYQYATGFAAATSLARQILQEGQPAVERYLDFLKAGNSDYPINILKKAGVDMATPEPVAQALQTFRELVDEMERLMAE